MRRSPIRTQSKKQNKVKAKLREVNKDEAGVCSLCGRERLTDGHHIIKRSQATELKTEPLNLVPLCSLFYPDSCHRWAEDNPKEFKNIMEEKEPARMAKLDLLSTTVGKVNQLRRLVHG